MLPCALMSRLKLVSTCNSLNECLWKSMHNLGTVSRMV